MTVFFWRTLILSLTVLVGPLTLSACGDDDEASGSDGKVHAITTLPLFADFVREVGGDRVEVEALLPAGADPHTWEPSPHDIAKIEGADIAFANGLDLDHGAVEVIESNLSDSAELVLLGETASPTVLDQIPSDLEERAIFEDATEDPHRWMSRPFVEGYVGLIAARLTAVDPDGEAIYTEGQSEYMAQVNDTAEYLRSQISLIPEEDRKLITTHDAFSLFAYEQRLELTAVVSETPGSDPSPDDIRAIVEAVEDAGVPAVFSEPQTSGESDVLEQVAEDTGAEVCTLYSDAFDDEVDTYIEMMRFNADELARCLGDGE